MFSSIIVQSDEEFHVYVRKAVHSYQTQAILRYVHAKFVNITLALKTGKQMGTLSDLFRKSTFEFWTFSHSEKHLLTHSMEQSPSSEANWFCS